MSKEQKSEVRCRLPWSVINELEEWVADDKIGNRQALLERIVEDALRRRRDAVRKRESRQRREGE